MWVQSCNVLESLRGAKEKPKVFSFCAMTWAKSKSLSEQRQCSQGGLSKGRMCVSFFWVFFAVSLPTVSKEKWVKEETADPMLRLLFELVVRK